MSRLPEIREQARNRWPSLLPMLGVGPTFLRDRHGPCPLCGGKDRFRFDNLEGRGTFICSQCGPGDGMRLAMECTQLPFAECAALIRERLGDTVEHAKRSRRSPQDERRAMAKTWQAARPLDPADDASVYLAGRGLTAACPDALRFHPEVVVSDHPMRRSLPALLARVSDHAGEGENVHRTYLEHGRKAVWTPVDSDVPASCRRMMPGGFSPEGAIRLGTHRGRLAVAEGIETALAVTRDYGLPCWSLVNSSQMERWIVPPDVTELHVFGDNDPKFGGQKAAYTLAHRAAVRSSGRRVFVHIPDQIGTDWADVAGLREAA